MHETIGNKSWSLQLVYEEISKIAHLNWRQKVNKFFSTRINPQNNVKLVNTQIKNSYYCKTQFFIFCLFFPFFELNTVWIWVLQKGVYALHSFHNGIPLAFYTPTLPILIRKRGQNTTKKRKKLHFPKYLFPFSHFTPHFWRYFCIFFSITCC